MAAVPRTVLLLSTYELGHPSFAVAEAAAWLSAAGHRVLVQDLSREKLDPEAVGAAELVALHLPMHTATRIAAEVLPRIRALNPTATLCGFGLYAPLNAGYLRSLGVTAILGGELEAELVALAADLAPREAAPLDRLDLKVPDRTGLPSLSGYAKVRAGGAERVAGYTEASRGCKHTCRHCPVVPVYGGRFRVVPQAVVLADVAQQVAAGAQHLTFGDPDFLNGPGHALPLVRALHARFPELTYDVTVKVTHLLERPEAMETLADTGCLFVTTAVESFDDAVLARLDKGHTAADVRRLVPRARAAGLTLSPTFIPFHPWTTLSGYRAFLAELAALGLVDATAPVQLTLRLLVPAGLRLLELAEVRDAVGEVDPPRLAHPWVHPDPRVDALQRHVAAVAAEAGPGADRRALFRRIWDLATAAIGDTAPPPVDPAPAPCTVPYLTEPWYC